MFEQGRSWRRSIPRRPILARAAPLSGPRAPSSRRTAVPPGAGSHAIEPSSRQTRSSRALPASSSDSCLGLSCSRALLGGVRRSAADLPAALVFCSSRSSCRSCPPPAAGRQSTRCVGDRGVVRPWAGLRLAKAGRRFLYRAANPTGGDVIAGVAAIIVVLEAARRDPRAGFSRSPRPFSWPTRSPVRCWLRSAWSVFAHRGYDLPATGRQPLHDARGDVRASPLDVAVTYIILFSLYGAVLERSGAGRFFLDFSMRLSVRARRRGRRSRSFGDASPDFSSARCRAAAWPPPSRLGRSHGRCFDEWGSGRPDTAGAMLAAAGIGALLSPPTLGAAAFLIAEYLRISYLQVLVMATIPDACTTSRSLLMIDGDARGQTSPGLTASAKASAVRRSFTRRRKAGGSESIASPT